MNRSEALRAKQRAYRLYPAAPGFRTAYMRGAHARIEGKTSTSCPYPEAGDASWSTAWYRAWQRGYRSARR